MKNIKMSVEGNILHMDVDLAQTGDISKSGKSIIIASTEGNKAIPGSDQIKIGLNVYKPNK